MVKLTNPKVAHADAVINLAKRLLNESQRLLNQASASDITQTSFDDLNKKIQFHVIILHKMLQEEHEMIVGEITRVNLHNEPGSLQQVIELKSLKEKTLKLHELAYMAEHQRAMTLQPTAAYATSFNP